LKLAGASTEYPEARIVGLEGISTDDPPIRTKAMWVKTGIGAPALRAASASGLVIMCSVETPRNGRVTLELLDRRKRTGICLGIGAGGLFTKQDKCRKQHDKGGTSRRNQSFCEARATPRQGRLYIAQGNRSKKVRLER